MPVEAVDGSTIRVYDSTNYKLNLLVQVQASSTPRTAMAKEYIVFQPERMQLQKGGMD